MSYDLSQEQLQIDEVGIANKNLLTLVNTPSCISQNPLKNYNFQSLPSV
jgi:hypothetical protein